MPAVDVEIQRMSEMGIIEHAKGLYCNPIRAVPKKNGEVRVCLDARFLNKQIESDLLGITTKNGGVIAKILWRPVFFQ